LKISFVILTWNRYKFLDLCLPALIAAIENPTECEIIVMDNGSTDDTKKVLSRYEQHSMVKIIHRKKNYGLNAYKQLFWKAKGKYVVIVDDDVLSSPDKLDCTFIDYMETFSAFGFLALDVVQNEFTNGAKPGREVYKEVCVDGKVLQEGPTGGWCSCFRKKDYRKICLKFLFSDLNMKNGEDGLIAHYFKVKLGLKSGIIKDLCCFHASGPHYAKMYGHLDREIEKYTLSGLHDFVKVYQDY
jgi:glycosyltransferase involved in cell wall biosynthesis